MDAQGSIGMRWDARAWTLRVGICVAVVLAAVAADLPADTTRAVGLGLGLGWMPVASAGDHVRRRWPGTVPMVGDLLVDLVALALVGVLVPVLAVPCAVAVAGVAAVHGLRADRAVQAAAVVIGVGTQLLLLDGGTVEGEVVAADLAAAAVWVLAAGEQARHRRRSREDLAHVGRLTDAVLAGVGEAVVVTGEGGLVLSSNAATETTFGHPVGGRCDAALQLAHPTGALDCRHVCPLLGPEGAPAQVEVQRTHPSGRNQALLVNVRAVRDPLGRISRVVHSFRDISALRQADEAKTLFLATASHELKTPLTVIGGFAELLRDDKLEGDRRVGALDAILARTTQLNAIVDRLLLASRIEGGAVDLHAREVDAATVVRRRASSAGDGLGRELHLDVPDDLPAVLADEVALATVVEHLVENAVKYSPDGQPVLVAARAAETHVHVEVTDRGIGMSAEDAARCFEPFWQAEAIESRRFGGSGVGLYVVRSLMLGMGGDVAVTQTAPGVGTTIRLTLRRADHAQEAAARTSAGATTSIDEWIRQIGVGAGG